MGGQAPITSVAGNVPMGNATGDIGGMSGTFSPMSSGGISPAQMMMISKALGSVGQQGAGAIPSPQLQSAQAGTPPQAQIGPGNTVPIVNPAMRQQMAQMLMGGQ